MTSYIYNHISLQRNDFISIVYFFIWYFVSMYLLAICILDMRLFRQFIEFKSEEVFFLLHSQ